MNGTKIAVDALLSGVSSLIYEICWIRQATLTFGVSIYAYSAVLTAYMGGVAIGGYLIGKRTDGAANPLRLFAWLQVGMAGRRTVRHQHAGVRVGLSVHGHFLHPAVGAA